MTRESNILETLPGLILEHELAANESVEESSSLCFEKLRKNISSLMGAPGYRALLTRALYLARKNDSSLLSIEVSEAGEVRGFTEAEHGEAEVKRVAKLLLISFFELLEGFIGEDLLLNLLSHIWPEIVLQAKKELSK